MIISSSLQNFTAGIYSILNLKSNYCLIIIFTLL